MMSERTQEAIRRVPNGAIVTLVLRRLKVFKAQTPEDVIDELVSIGLTVLWEAESTFNPEKGVSLATHQYGKVRWAILDYMRRPKGFYGRIVHMRIQSMHTVENHLSHRYFTKPTRKQIADVMGISQKQIDALVSAQMSIFDTQSVDLLASENDEDSIFGQIEFESEVKYLRKKFTELSFDEWQFLSLYHFEEHTFESVAEKMQCSIQTLRRIRSSSYGKLRRAMRPGIAQ